MTPKMQAARPIKVSIAAVDGYRATRSFVSLGQAQAFAQKYVGATPELGFSYAVAPDGVVKAYAEGVALLDLFPALKPEYEALAREAALDAADAAERAANPYVACEHGLDSRLCDGPDHYPADVIY